VEDTISGEHILKDIDDTISLSARFLQQLSPANSIILVKHRGFQGATKLTEPWYGTQYNEKKFDEELLSKWTAALEGITMVDIDKLLKLPVANPFLPTDFQLRGDTENAEENTPVAPSLIENIVVAHVVSGEGDVDADAPKDEGVTDEKPKSSEEGVVEAEEAPPSDPSPAAAPEEEGAEEEEEGEEEEEKNAADAVELKALPGRVRMTWFKQVLFTTIRFQSDCNNKFILC